MSKEEEDNNYVIILKNGDILHIQCGYFIVTPEPNMITEKPLKYEFFSNTPPTCYLIATFNFDNVVGVLQKKVLDENNELSTRSNPIRVSVDKNILSLDIHLDYEKYEIVTYSNKNNRSYYKFCDKYGDITASFNFKHTTYVAKEGVFVPYPKHIKLGCC